MNLLFDIPHLITTYGYVGIFIIVFLESGIFFALPGDSLLFTAGLFASALGLNVLFLISLIILATFLGGLAGYEIGAYLITLEERYKFLRKILKKEHIDKAHKFFDKHGAFAIVFSRFIPIIRTFVPIVAGIARMHYYDFVKYSIISSVIWSSVVTLLGYFLGQTFPVIKDYLFLMVILVILISVLPLILQVKIKGKGFKFLP